MNAAIAENTVNGLAIADSALDNFRRCLVTEMQPRHRSSISDRSVPGVVGDPGVNP